MGFSIAEFICDNARRRPNSVALREGERSMSYAELDGAARCIAAQLAARGIAAGDRVCFVLPNSIALVRTYYGIHMAGAIPVPINPLLAVPEIANILRDCGPLALIAGTATQEKARQALHAADSASVLLDADSPEFHSAPPSDFEPRVNGQPGDTAVILYTSGTTGKAKGVELTHFNVFWNSQLFARDLVHLSPKDRCLAVMPLSHAAGHTCAMNAAMFTGAGITLMERFDPASVLRTIARDRISIFLGVPAMFWSLLDTPIPPGCDLSSLRACTSGSQALPEEVHRAFEARFGVEIAEGYGLTEASPNITFNPYGAKKIGSAGTAVWGVSIRIVDEQGAILPTGQRGEVIAHGPGIMKGYFGSPQATSTTVRDDWLFTGDIGHLDEDGYLYIVDRMKDVIISGGYKVYPREIEEVLYAHPDVLEASVIGWPDAKLGEKPFAYVAAKPGRPLDLDALRAWCGERLARYKVPREFRIVPQLPKGATGKIDRLSLKKIAAGSSAEIK